MLKNKQLSHALALEAHGNFRRAAAAQHISQPAFSRSIRALEDALGVPLFNRGGNRVTTTPYGELVLVRAKRLIQEIEDLEYDVRSLKGVTGGRLAVGLGTHASELSGAQALGELVQEHNNLKVELHTTMWDEIIEMVRTRKIDLGMAEIGSALADASLQLELVGTHDMVFFCRHGHPLLTRSKVSKADLGNYPLVMARVPQRGAKLMPGKGTLDESTGEFTPAVHMDDMNSARAVVAASDAFSAAAPLQIERWLKSGELRVLPFRKPWMKLHYGFIYLSNRVLNPAAVAYMERVRRIEAVVALRNEALMQQLF